MSAIASYNICSSMRQKVKRSVGRLQKVVIYVRFPRNTRSQAIHVKLTDWKKLGVLG